MYEKNAIGCIYILPVQKSVLKLEEYNILSCPQSIANRVF